MTRTPLPMRHGGISSPRMRLKRARSSVLILGFSGLRRRAAEKPPEGSADKDRLTTLGLVDPRSPFKVYSTCDHRGPINTLHARQICMALNDPKVRAQRNRYREP